MAYLMEDVLLTWDLGLQTLSLAPGP